MEFEKASGKTMGLFDDFLDSLKNEKNKELVLPDALVFPALDIDKLDQEIQLADTAKLNGERDLPPSDSTRADYLEQRIIDYAITSVRPFQDSYSEALVAYNARLAALDPLGFDAKIRGIAAKKKAEIQMVATQAQGEIYLNENNLRQRELEYEKFKEKHGNPADPVFNVPKWVKYLIIVGLVAGEALLNSSLIGPFMLGGWQEGMFYALGIPLLSIVFFGLMAGVALRRFTIATLQWKLIYSGAILFATCGSLVITLGLASLRAATVATENYMDVFWPVLKSYLILDPLYPLTLDQIMLILLGFAFFIVATIDIKSLDHPIPGFVEAFKTRERAHQDYNKQMEALNKKLVQTADTSLEIHKAFDSLQAWQVEYQNILINRSQLIQSFNGYIKHIESQINNIVSKYRQINRMHRSTTAPAYFNTSWSYPEYTGEHFDNERLADDFREKIKTVYKNIEGIQKEIDQEVRRLPMVLTSIGKALEK
jgi:hypothetical protein